MILEPENRIRKRFLKFSENSEKHRLAGAKYRDISRRLSFLYDKYSKEKGDEKRLELINELKNMDQEMEKLAEESLSLPDRFYDKAKKEQMRKSPAFGDGA